MIKKSIIMDIIFTIIILIEMAVLTIKYGFVDNIGPNLIGLTFTGLILYNNKLRRDNYKHDKEFGELCDKWLKETKTDDEYLEKVREYEKENK